MTKRPLDADMDVQSKKVCLHPELEAMKATLESLLKTADEHHEEARIGAIDHASELEEKWTECTVCRDNMTKEFEKVSNELEAACTYVETFESSDTVCMLKKASESKVVHTLVEDHAKILDTLVKLRSLKSRLQDSKCTLEGELQQQTEKCEQLKTELAAAEARVESITKLR